MPEPGDTKPFDVERRWPELFEQLDAEQRRSVVGALAVSWHEGWLPEREHVENLTDYMRGAIDKQEYFRRARSTARNVTNARRVASS